MGQGLSFWLRKRALFVSLLVILACAAAWGVYYSIGQRDADEGFRKYLWDVEHIAFMVEAKTFPKLKQAIVERDAAAIEALLAGKFTGKVPDGEWQPHYWDERIEIRRLAAAAGGKVVGPGEFARELIAWRDLLDAKTGCCGIEIGLVRLSPVTRGKLDGPWQGIWRFRLYGEHAACPVEVSFRATVDLDPLDDNLEQRKKYIRSAAIEMVQETRSGEPLMADVTAQSGINTSALHDNWTSTKKHQGKSGGVYLWDYDQDGNLDVLIDDYGPQAITLYRGLGDGRFKDTTLWAGLPDRPSPAQREAPLPCIADLDGDGDEDLLLTNRVFENQGHGHFVEVTERSNLNITGAGGLAIADFDRDGLVDLYEFHSINPSYRQKPSERKRGAWIDGGWGFTSVLWRNLGNWRFEDVTDRAGAGGAGVSAFSAVWLDFNNDRWPDLLVINEFGRNDLLLNQGDGTFRPIDDLDPVFGGFSMGVTTGDYNNDGLTDIHVANMYSKAGNRILSNLDPRQYSPELHAKISEATTGSKMYRNRGDGKFDLVPPQDALREIGWTYGANFFDLNGDGHLDLYCTAGFLSYERGKPDG